MKKTTTAVLFAVSIALRVHAQGYVAFDNFNNANLTPDATSGGGVFDCGVLATGNFNLSLYGGNSPTNLVLLATLLQSNGSAATGAAIGAPGQWIDTAGEIYRVPGVPIASLGFFKVYAWEGDFSSYAEALAAGQCAGSSDVFQNPTRSPTAAPPDLTGMPSFDICPDCPEPGTLAVGGLGAASLLLFRRNK